MRNTIPRTKKKWTKTIPSIFQTECICEAVSAIKRMKELKKELGNGYVFERLLSERDVRRLMKLNPRPFEVQTVLSLTVGFVKIEMCIYPQNGKLALGYDVFVKDTPESSEWICYDSPDDPANFREEDMLSVLDRVVRENGLSYPECCFEKLNGKVIGKKKETEVQDNG